MEQKKAGWKTNPVFAIIAIALIIVVLFVGRSCARRGGTPPLNTVKFYAIDKETGDIFEMKMKVSELNNMPYMSPKTGRKTAFRALQCQNCRSIYAWEKEAAFDNKCPVCNTQMPPVPLMYDPNAAKLKEE